MGIEKNLRKMLDKGIQIVYNKNAQNARALLELYNVL